MDLEKLFSNLMVMAAVDGVVTQEELDFLVERADRWGLTQEQVKLAIEKASGPNAQISIPESRDDRLATCRLLLRTMAVDGELSELEKRLFAHATTKMNINTDEINAMIDEL